MGGESEAYGDAKDGLKRKICDSIELAKQKAQELAARLNVDAETKRARVENTYTSPVPPAGAFSQPAFHGNSQNYESRATSYSSYGSAPISRKISIPNDKVGVVIGKGGDTIKSLQLQSGARIQIAKESDPSNMATRDVDLVGTAEQVSRAEELINGVLAEVDAGGSAPGGAYGSRCGPTGGDQIVMKIPDNRVALLIGKGGETIKTIQSRSGARLQIVPLRPPPNEILTERSVFINGSQEQIDSAQEMVNEIVREGRLRIPPSSSSYMQPAPASLAPPGQALNQPYQTGYEYSVPGAYPPPPPPSYYGDYGTNPQAGWDQSNPTLVPPPHQTSGYNYYGQPDQTGSAPPAYGYGYSQPQAPVTSESSNQGYLATSYPVTAAYGQPLKHAPPPNPAAYSQGTVPYAAYGNPQGYSVPPTSQPAYATSNANIVLPTSQPAYGTSYPVASQPAYGTQQGLPSNTAPQAAYGAQQGYSVPPTYNLAGYGGPQHTSLPPPPSFTPPPPYGQSAYPAQPNHPPAAQPAQAHTSKPIVEVSAAQVNDSSSPAIQTAPNYSSRAT